MASGRPFGLPCLETTRPKAPANGMETTGFVAKARVIPTATDGPDRIPE
ncbi:hypothetical protein NJ7G_2075 [Natrinema sp. J7-2]|nr:hypothetical protein NJ7G_2075 [Natrinema sp. J7-2]